MAVVQFRQGDHAQALHNARTSLQLLQGMGAAPDAAQVAALIQQMEAALPFAAAVALWRDGGRDEARLITLLDQAASLYVQAMRGAVRAERWRLADELALLRAAGPLSIAGAGELLALLQLRLRGKPSMAERAAQLQAALPAPLAEALAAMEQAISAGQ